MVELMELMLVERLVERLEKSSVVRRVDKMVERWVELTGSKLVDE